MGRERWILVRILVTLKGVTKDDLTSSSGIMATQTSWTMSVHPACNSTAASSTHTCFPVEVEWVPGLNNCQKKKKNIEGEERRKSLPSSLACCTLSFTRSAISGHTILVRAFNRSYTHTHMFIMYIYWIVYYCSRNPWPLMGQNYFFFLHAHIFSLHLVSEHLHAQCSSVNGLILVHDIWHGGHKNKCVQRKWVKRARDGYVKTGRPSPVPNSCTIRW